MWWSIGLRQLSVWDLFLWLVLVLVASMGIYIALLAHCILFVTVKKYIMMLLLRTLFIGAKEVLLATILVIIVTFSGFIHTLVVYYNLLFSVIRIRVTIMTV